MRVTHPGVVPNSCCTHPTPPPPDSHHSHCASKHHHQLPDLCPCPSPSLRPYTRCSTWEWPHQRSPQTPCCSGCRTTRCCSSQRTQTSRPRARARASCHLQRCCALRCCSLRACCPPTGSRSSRWQPPCCWCSARCWLETAPKLSRSCWHRWWACLCWTRAWWRGAGQAEWAMPGHGQLAVAVPGSGWKTRGSQAGPGWHLH